MPYNKLPEDEVKEEDAVVEVPKEEVKQEPPKEEEKPVVGIISGVGYPLK